MIDGLPLGDGTSRKIICNTNIPASWEDFRTALTSSGILIDLSINESGWYELGTKLNKDNLLTDEAAARFGLYDETVTPDDVFKVIPTGMEAIVWGNFIGNIQNQTDLWDILVNKLNTSSIVQSVGQSDSEVMSQKAVTDALTEKVDAVENMGLTHNDYTNADKEKVDIISTTGQGNLYLSNDGTYKEIGNVQWSEITGDISENTDLSNALSQKVDNSSVVQDTGHSQTNIMSQKAVSDALAEISANAGGYRGVVLHAFEQENVYRISGAVINDAGSSYNKGQIAIINLPDNRIINGWVVIDAVDENGAVITIGVSGVGAWSTDDSAEGVSTFTDGDGNGLTLDITMSSGAGLTLNDLVNPRKGDSALVLRDETNGNAKWNWLYADFNGDGIANWVPAGSAGEDVVPDDETYITSSTGVRTLTSFKKTLLDNAEQNTNKTNSLSSSSTVTQYPNANVTWSTFINNISVTSGNNGLETISSTKGDNTTNLGKIIENVTSPNLVLASKEASEGSDSPAFRALTTNDLPTGSIYGLTGTFTVSSWGTAPNTVSTNISSITSDHLVTLDVVLSTTQSTRQTQLTEFAKLDMVESYNNGIRIYYDNNTPSTSLTFRYKAELIK
jgi:hypothetical protein